MPTAGVELIVEEELEPGTPVEVRTRFEGRWARGFEVAGTAEGGYLVRRLSDGAVLPTPFDPDDVRKERKRRDFWWY